MILCWGLIHYVHVRTLSVSDIAPCLGCMACQDIEESPQYWYIRLDGRQAGGDCSCHGRLLRVVVGHEAHEDGHPAWYSVGLSGVLECSSVAHKDERQVR